MNDQSQEALQERPEFPGGEVYFKKAGKFSFLKRFRGPLNLSQLSKSSVKISGLIPVKVKTCLDLKIVLSGKESILLRGYFNGPQDPAGEDVQSQIQLLPFGDGRNYNSFSAKKILETLIDDPADRHDQVSIHGR